LTTVASQSLGMDKAKMNWIYEAPGDRINREEYLLGKKVDKYIDPTLQAAEREKHLLATTPGALFASTSSNATVDLENKIREDPLFEIKKREQEAKKRLASNPVKLKQLRALVDEVRSTSSGGKKRKKKHKHKRKGSDSSEDEIRPTPGSSSRHVEDKHSVHRHGNSDIRTGRERRYRSRSPPCTEKHHSSPHSSTFEGRRSSHSSRRYHHQQQEIVSKKLSREELEKKRQEMMINAEWHAQKASDRMKKHRMEEEKEEIERQEHAGREQEFVDPLMAETLADATAGTISDRIHRKIGSVQRTRAALEGNFTRK